MNLLYFGPLRDLTGRPTQEYRCTAAIPVKKLIEWVARENPEAAPLLQSCAISINLEYVDDWDALAYPEDEVAFVPPVSAG